MDVDVSAQTNSRGRHGFPLNGSPPVTPTIANAGAGGSAPVGHDRFVAQNHLEETIVHALGEDPGSGAAIRAAFENAPIPSDVEREILAAYEQLGQGPVAVRSRATAEDLPGAAFAGQQETFLNVVGSSALLDAVRRCWASLWSDRAIAYRRRQGMDQRPGTLSLAVVVQRMVAADVAGVLFTADPVTGARDEIIIDASPGLGEAVMAGLVTPDQYALKKRVWGWQVVERRRGDARSWSDPGRGQTIHPPGPPNHRAA